MLIRWWFNARAGRRLLWWEEGCYGSGFILVNVGVGRRLACWWWFYVGQC